MQDSSLLLLGRRGMGKSYILRQLAVQASARGVAPSGTVNPLILALAPGLSLAESIALAGCPPRGGVRDPLQRAALAALAAGQTLVVSIDELHHLTRADAGELAAALEQCAQQRLPVRLHAAGLPSIEQRLGPMFSLLARHAARIELAPLSDSEAASMLIATAAPRGRKFAASALTALAQRCGGVPQLLECWVRHVCAVAAEPVIRLADVEVAAPRVQAELDAGFFSAPLASLGVAERAYLSAMAALGDAPVRSGAVAARLGRPVTAMAPLRAMLINKHLLYAPDYGWTAFTTPLHAAYLRRAEFTPRPAVAFAQRS